MKLPTILKILAILTISCSVLSAVDPQEVEDAPNDKWHNICYDGKDPSTWTEKKKLQEFAKGPCSPVVLVSGIGASDLQIEIDCETLYKSDPDVFSTCGWTGCGPNDKKPKSEYQVWVSAPESEMSILSPLERNKNCFAAFFSTNYDYTKQSPAYLPKEGVKLKPVGATPGTRNQEASDCAMDGIVDLIPDIPNPEWTGNFKGIRNRLRHMGYESGLTMQAVPYDFRINCGDDLLGKAYPKIVQELSEMTNKKVQILAHSMGNMRTAYFLWNADQSFKDKYIDNYIAVAPTWIGSAKLLSYLTCGTKTYTFPFHSGFDWSTFKKTVYNFSSMYQMIPYNTFNSQKDTDWMKKIMKRIDYENGKTDDPVFEWLPTKEERCYLDWPDSPNCRSGLYVLDNYGSDKDGNKITNDNLKEMLGKLTWNQHSDYQWKGRESRYETLPNFGVNLTTIFSQVLDTELGYNFKVNPKDWLNSQNKFCTVQTGGFDIIFKPGDTSVPSTSAVTPSIKFAEDFKNKVANAKPVKILEICSGVHAIDSPYDSHNDKGEGIYTKNEYIGIPCDCKAGKDKHCDHVTMLWLKNFWNMMSTTLNKGVRSQLTPEYENKDDAFYKNWVSTCRLFYESHNPEEAKGIMKQDKKAQKKKSKMLQKE